MEEVQIVEENKTEQPQVNTEQQFQLQDPFDYFVQSDITIFVTDPTIKEDKYHLTTSYFTIQGKDKFGEFKIERQFDDFNKIRNVIVKQNPGVYVPTTPSKKLIGFQDERIIRERLRNLNHFVKSISAKSNIYYLDEFQTFIRNPISDFSKNADENLIPFKILQNFRKYYGKEIDEFSSKVNSETYEKIAKYKLYFKSKISILEKSRQQVSQLIEAQYQYMTQYSAFINTSMPNYEEVNKIDFDEDFEMTPILGVQSQSKKLPEFKYLLNCYQYNTFFLPYDYLCYELRDFRAFLEMIDQLEFWETKKTDQEKSLNKKEKEISDISEGKKTFKSVFSTMTKSQDEYRVQLSSEIENTKISIKQIDELLPIIAGFIVYVEINSHIKTKRDYYIHIMKNFANYQVQYNSRMSEFWNEIKDL